MRIYVIRKYKSNKNQWRNLKNLKYIDFLYQSTKDGIKDLTPLKDIDGLKIAVIKDGRSQKMSYDEMIALRNEQGSLRAIDKNK